MDKESGVSKGTKSKRYWSAKEKAKIVREHLYKRTAISTLAEKYGATPGQISTWCKLALENIELSFSADQKKADKSYERKLSKQSAKVTKLQEVITELTMEVINLKKQDGV